jgi:hypothetical protein
VIAPPLGLLGCGGSRSEVAPGASYA